MDPAPVEFNPHSLETEVAALWKARRLPSPGGALGPPGGPTVREFVGSWTQGDFPALVAHRAVAADVDARYLALTGRRASGSLRQGTAPGPAPPSTVPALLTALGVWVGGDGRIPWDSEERPAQVQTIVGRLARQEILVTRDESFRICPSCGTLRTPERIIYDEQEGDTYLVRFPLRVGDWTVNALVWVDAPWKLLGASALLLNPNLKYVVAGYHRRDDRELILTSASSLDRLRAWIPESILEVVEERTGKEFQGIAYTYPLRHEFPMGGDLTPPAGTLLAAADVGDSGTGIVPLVPGHGPTDAKIADRLGVTGWPLLTPKGRLDFTLMHKYAGLDLDTANEFVLRDLSEAGALLARLRVKRGVPYCSICGTALLWAPARAWCLEAPRLPPERRALFARLLPHEALPGPGEVAPWPVSEANSSDDPAAVSLLECPRCERLDGPDGPKQCPCGGQRSLVRRKLLPSISTALAAWARYDPFPEGDSARLYVGKRRRVPSLVHHLVALSGVEGSVTDVSLSVVPTVASDDLPMLVGTHGADVVRAAVIRGGLSETAGARFSDQCERESDRLRRWWLLSREVASQCDASMIAEFARPIGGFLGELEVEDRAVVARWERTRVLALAHYDQAAPGLAHRRVARFLDNDLVEYRSMVQARFVQPGTPPTKRAVLRTLAHILRGVSEVLAPIVPFTSESVHRAFSPDRTSLFERPLLGIDRALLNDDLCAAWDRWRTVLRTVAQFRHSVGIRRSTVLPSLVLVVPADDLGDRFRGEKDVLARLLRVHKLEVGSPREPWRGRQRVMHPVEAEIQKVYPTHASQIMHLLQRMAPRRGTSAAGEEELSVVIDSYPVRIFPSMISIEETLPRRTVPIPWSLGEMYVELPAEVQPTRAPMPPLSPDAFWLVRRLERRLRLAPTAPGQPAHVAIVTVKDPLATELRSLAGPVARALGLAELRVVDKAEEAVPPNAVTGRTRTGDHWWVHVPGLPLPAPRAKRPRAGQRLQRISSPQPTGVSVEVDYADEKVAAHAEEVRTLGRELDDIVGIPLLGPAKISTAWDQGLHSVDDIRRAPFEMVSALPGFGGPVAEVVVSKIGGTVPPRSARVRPPRGATPTSARPARVSPPPVSSTLSGPVTAASAPEIFPLPVPEAPPPESELPRLAEPEHPPSLPPPAELTPPVVAPPAPSPAGEPEVPAPSLTAPETSGSEGAGTDHAVEEEKVALEAGPETAIVPPIPPAEVSPPQEAAPPIEATAPVVSEPSPVEAPVPPNAPLVEPTPLPLEQAAPVEEFVAPPAAAGPPPEQVPPLVSEPEGPILEATTAPEPETEVTPPAEPLLPVEAPAAPPMAETPVPAPAEIVVTEPVALPEEPTAPEVFSPALAPEITPSPPTEPLPVPLPEETPTPPIEVAPPPPEQMPEHEAELAPEPTTPGEPAPEAMASIVPETVREVPSEREEPVAPSAGPPTLEPTLEVPSPPEPLPPKVEPAVPSPPVSPESPAGGPHAPPEMPAPAEPEPSLPPSGVELTLGGSLVASLGDFLDSTSAGHHGVCVVRESPERIRARVGSRPIEVYWLSNIGRGPSLRPADLEGMWALLSRKLLQEHATAFFLEGIEYLVRIHSADTVLTGLVQFDRLARENDARVWVYLTPALMKPADIDRFRATFGGDSSPSSEAGDPR